MKSLSFVIPVFNSEKTILHVVVEIEEAVSALRGEYDYEIILVDDFSSDNTLEICKCLCHSRPFINLISFSKNFGQHHAILAGLREARGEYIVILDDDLQTPPKETGKLIDTLEEGYDVVFAQYASKRYSIFRNAGSKLDALMSEVLISKPKNIDTNSFAIMRKYVVDEIINYDKPYPYITGLVFQITTNIGGVQVEHRDRQSGRSNYRLKKLVSLWFNGFTNFSVKPLRISSLTGFMFSAIAFMYFLVLIFRKIFHPQILTGWTPVMVMIMFFGGIQLMSLGLVGEYVGRIFMCMNKIPQYVIKERFSSNEVEK